MDIYSVIKDYYNYQYILHLSQQEYDAFCLKKLHKLIHFTLSHSPFYQKLYKEHGINEKDVDQLTIDDLPVTNKKLLMENFDAVVTDHEIKIKNVKDRIFLEPEKFKTPFLEKYYLLRTSGSAGEPAMFVYTKEHLDYASRAAMIRSEDFIPNLLSKKRIAFCGMSGYYLGAIGVSSLQNPLVDSRIIPCFPSLEKFISELEAFQPNYIVSYSSIANLIAEESLKGHLKINPLVIKCSADPLYPSYRKTIKKAFPLVKIENNYTSTEFGLMGKQSDQDLHFINHRDLCWIDEKSHTFTNMYNTTFPTIKYKNEDSFKIVESKGQKDPFTRLQLDSFRKYDTFSFVDNYGRPTYLNLIELILFNVNGLYQFQFWQEVDNCLLVKIVGTGDILVEEMQQEIHKLLVSKNSEKSIKVVVERVEKLTNDPITGKFKMFNINNPQKITNMV